MEDPKEDPSAFTSIPLSGTRSSASAAANNNAPASRPGAAAAAAMPADPLSGSESVVAEKGVRGGDSIRPNQQQQQEEVVKEMVRHYERVSASVEAAVLSSEKGRGAQARDENGSGGPEIRASEGESSVAAGAGSVGSQAGDGTDKELLRPQGAADSSGQLPRKGATRPRKGKPPPRRQQSRQQQGALQTERKAGPGAVGEIWGAGVKWSWNLITGRSFFPREPSAQENDSLLGMAGVLPRGVSSPSPSTPSAQVPPGQGPASAGHGASPQTSLLESLDYEVIENAVYREDQARKGKIDQIGYLALKWVFALLLGIATGLAAFLINVAVEILAGWKFVATSWVMQYSQTLAFFVYMAFNVGLVFTSATIITRYSPAAAGSGIPEIKGYLNGVDMPGILLTRTLVGKFLGSIGSVAGGLALGKEGPLVHTGACLAAFIGQGGSTHYHLNFKWMRLFANDRDRRDMVTCGAAAGAAAAFRAPVGGVLFALEEVTSWWRPQLLWRVFFTSAIVAVVLRACMRWCASGECGKFASGGFIIWDVHGGTGDYFSYELLPMAMLGLMGGLMGALYNQLTVYISAWRRNKLHPLGNRVKVFEACLIATVTSALSFAVPFAASCQACPDPIRHPDVVCPRPRYHWGNFVQFNCQGNSEYNDLASIFFNTQDDAIRNLFSNGNIMVYSPQSLIIFLISFYALSIITYGIAVPSGQFVPGIMIGATYGRLVGMLMVKIYGRDVIDEGTYALLGAASFLGGSMRMTVSLCVIMVEITNNLNLLPLIMLVLLISKAVGDGLNPGFYDVHAHVRAIPILEGQSKRFLRTLSAKDAASTKVVYFSRVEMVGRIVEALRSTPHNGFPVLEDLQGGETELAGLILRSQLLVLLQKKTDFQDSSEISAARVLRSQYSFSDFTKSVSVKGAMIGDIHLTKEDLTKWLDLKPFLNPTPYLVDENMSLTKVHAVFRSLGLRHLCVIPRPPRAVGIITRKDLLPEVLEGRCKEPDELFLDDGPVEALSPRPLATSPWTGTR